MLQHLHPSPHWAEFACRTRCLARPQDLQQVPNAGRKLQFSQKEKRKETNENQLMKGNENSD